MLKINRLTTIKQNKSNMIDLNRLKTDITIENVLTLKKVINLLLKNLEEEKKRTTNNVGFANAIARLIKTQNTLLCGLADQPETKIYLRILQAPDGRIPQQELLANPETFDSDWEAITNLKEQGLIKAEGEKLKDRVLIAVDQSN